MFDQIFTFELDELVSCIKKNTSRILQVFFLSLGLAISTFGLWRWHQSKMSDYDAVSSEDPIEKSASVESVRTSAYGQIVIDVSGAVENPGIYEVEIGTRVGQVLEQAGGLRADADKQTLSQSINLAKEVQDEEKIYVPFAEEKEISRNVTGGGSSAKKSQAEKKVSINLASQSELESLPGIGAKRAEDIISGRPYSQLKDLMDQGILSSNLFEDIEEVIEL